MLDNLYIGLDFSTPWYKQAIADDQKCFKGLKKMTGLQNFASAMKQFPLLERIHSTRIV